MDPYSPHHDAEEAEIQELEDPSGWLYKPRGLDIVWGNNTHRWRLPTAKADGPAELLGVTWLEVTGSSKENLNPGKTYEICFLVSMKWDPIDWNDIPIYVMAKIGKNGNYRWRRINLVDQDANKQFEIPEGKLRIKVPSTESDDTKLYFGLFSLWQPGQPKSGLLIHEARVQQEMLSQ